MARPRSEEKQIALLEAATEVVASDGLSASTLLIAKTAGFSEGTLFRYFPTKDDLFNALFLHLRQALHDAMMENYDAGADLIDRARSVWDGYVNWGIANPSANRALSQLSVSDKIAALTRTKAANLFPEIKGMRDVCVTTGVLAQRPSAFADAIFMALADATMSFAASDPVQADGYMEAGFNVLWKGLTR